MRLCVRLVLQYEEQSPFHFESLIYSTIYFILDIDFENENKEKNHIFVNWQEKHIDMNGVGSLLS